jgi:DNA-binding response OmpR family regulator
MRVLVVEDHVDLGELLAELLSVEGAAATTAQTGHLALELSRTRRFDVVLCDLGLPDIPGEIVIRHLRATTARPPVVIGITGGGELHVRRAMAAGAKVVFGKPLDWERIVAFLRELEGPPGDVSDVAS